MANIKSAIKRIRTSESRRLRNKNRVSRIRTFIKKVEAALTTGDATAAQTAFRELQPEIARGAAKGALHLNTGSRTLSRLSSKIKALGTQKEAA